MNAWCRRSVQLVERVTPSSPWTTVPTTTPMFQWATVRLHEPREQLGPIVRDRRRRMSLDQRPLRRMVRVAFQATPWDTGRTKLAASMRREAEPREPVCAAATTRTGDAPGSRRTGRRGRVASGRRSALRHRLPITATIAVPRRSITLANRSSFPSKNPYSAPTENSARGAISLSVASWNPLRAKTSSAASRMCSRLSESCSRRRCARVTRHARRRPADGRSMIWHVGGNVHDRSEHVAALVRSLGRGEAGEELVHRVEELRLALIGLGSP